MNDPSSDTESVASTELVEVESDWKILPEDSEWTVGFRDLKFRHPRVLLAYLRFVAFHNEMATNEDETILLPLIPSSVADFILNHISFKETPKEFLDEVKCLRRYIYLLS